MRFKPYYSSGARIFYGMSSDDLPENAVTGDKAHIIDTAADLINYEGGWFTASTGKSIACKIISGKLRISDTDYPLVLDGTDGTITVPYGTTVTSLQPSFVISKDATISPTEAQDFSDGAVTYTVTAEDSDYSTAYSITVIVEEEEEPES